MRPDERRSLELMAEGGWVTSLDLSRRLGFSTQYARGILGNLRHVGWAHRGGLNSYGGRLWRITAEGLAKIEPEPRTKAPPSYQEKVRIREAALQRPSRDAVPRLNVGNQTVTLDQYKAWQARVGERAAPTTLSQPLGKVSKGHKRKAASKKQRGTT